MANKKINQLTSKTALLNNDDFLMVYDSEETGSEPTKKVAISDYAAVISSDTAIYVATTGSDVTGDGSSGNPFASIAGAVEWLKNKKINLDANVIIQLADGHYAISEEIAPKFESKNVTITGENVETISLTSIQSVSGSSGDYDVILNVDNVSNLTVGDLVVVPGDVTGGTNPDIIKGAWPITNIDSGNSRITINTTMNSSLQPSGAVSGTLSIPKTVIDTTSCNGFSATNTVMLTISNISISNDSRSGSAVFASTNGSLRCEGIVAINGLSNGIYCIRGGSVQATSYTLYTSNCVAGVNGDYGGNIIGAYMISTGNTHGFKSYNGSLVYVNVCQSYGNSAYGAIATLGGTIYCPNGIFRYNYYHGVVCSVGASIRGDYGNSSDNGSSGISCSQNATVYFENGTITNNSVYGIYARLYGFVDALSASVSGNGTNFSPNANTQGNEYGYINT